MTKLNKDNYTAENVNMRISGKKMNKSDGYDLPKVIESLDSFANLVTKAYLFSNDKQRFTKEDKDKFSIKLIDVHEGSFISEMQIVYTTTILPAIPMVIENRQVIIDAVKVCYEFLKEKSKVEKEGKILEVNQTSEANGINVVNNGNGNVTINVNPGIPQMSQDIAPAIKRMAETVDGKEIESLIITDDFEHDDNPIKITKEDKEIFSSRTFVDETRITFFGKIIDGNFHNQSGRLEVIDCNDDRLTIGDIYPFSVKENLQAEEVWKQMFLESKPYYGFVRVNFNPISNPSIKVIEIIIEDWDQELWDENNGI